MEDFVSSVCVSNCVFDIRDASAHAYATDLFMQDSDWQTIKQAFHETLDLPKNERLQFLANQPDFVCTKVSRLLDSHEKLEDFIAEPVSVEIGLSIESYIGKSIGSYKILAHIGSGGMGQVFLAEKEGLDKKFALKIIKRGMDTDAVLKRFVRERQILSRLEHSNIATLLDGGSTENDLPYFVMEYVEGETVTKFCEAHQLDTNERLRIFQKVCNAVSYAHQNLVVHRDIKPSNILVNADGKPKLLDFGIAKLLNSNEYEATATQARILTPEYASPEQLSDSPITTATDVYSLGVVLYELLCGTRPGAVVGDRWSAIKNTDRKKVGTRIENNPESKTQNPKSLTGDLKNIVNRSLQEEPDRRYQSVQEFSEDVRRYLIGLPVSATADSNLYRFSKFVQRHWQAAIVGSFITLLVLTISGVAVWQGIVAMREREKADKRFEQVRKLANIVLFEYHDGIAQLPGATAMREKMVKDSLEFLDNLSAESGDSLDLQRDIVKAYRKVGDIQAASDTGNIGKTQNALQSYQKAFGLQEKIAEGNSENVEDQMILGDLSLDIGLQSRSIGDLQIAEEHFQNALNIFTDLRKDSPNDLKSLSGLARTFWNIASLQTAGNNLEGSLENYQKAIEIYEKLAVDEPNNPRHLRNVALTNKNIGSVWQLFGENEKALQYFQKSLAIDLENAENNPNDVSAQLDLSFTYGTTGSALRNAKNFQGSVENYQKAIDIRERLFNADNRNAFAENALARGYQELGKTFLAQHQYVGAEEMLDRSQKIFQKMSDADVENYDKKARIAENLTLLGYVNGSNQNLNKATDYYSKSLEIYADLLKQGKLSTLNQRRFASVYLDYGEILLKNKQSAKALEKLQKAQELMENDKVRRDANEELAKLNRLLSEAAGK